MKVLLLEGFMTGSHAQWANELKKYSSHDITLLTLPGRFWKWRMHGGAVSLANEFLKLEERFDLII